MTIWYCKGDHILKNDRIASCPWCGELWCLDHAEERNMVCSECQTMMVQDKQYGWYNWTGKSRRRFYGAVAVHSDTDIPSIHAPVGRYLRY
jgi:hypothetical protein